ncbi:MAG: CAP domain-containing protein [Desulfovibrionaceae bacterium]
MIKSSLLQTCFALRIVAGSAALRRSARGLAAGLVLAALALLTACLGGALDPAPPIAKPDFPQPGRAGYEPSPAERLLAGINAERAAAGLAPLAPDALLGQLAEEHAARVARTRPADPHEGFEARLRSAGRALCVENVSIGPGRPDEILAGWLAAPDLRAGLLTPELRGAGLARVDQVTVLFACSP